MKLIIPALRRAYLQPSGVVKPKLQVPALEVKAVAQTTASLVFSSPDTAAQGKVFHLTVNGLDVGAVSSPYILSGLLPETEVKLGLYVTAQGYKDSDPATFTFSTLPVVVVPDRPDFSKIKAIFIGDSYYKDYNLHCPTINMLGIKDFYLDAQGGRRMARTVSDDGRVAVVDSIDSTLAANPTAGVVIIQAITNDAYYKVPIGGSSSTDKTTFYGALKYVADTINTKLPTALVYYITPMQTPRTTFDGSPVDGTSLDYLQTYIDAQVAVFGAAGFKKIDIFNNDKLSLAKNNLISTDGIHPDTVYGKTVYPSAVSNGVVPLVKPTVKSIAIVDGKTIAVTFDSSLLGFSLAGLSLLKNNSVVNFTSFVPVAGNIMSDLPGSIYNLTLAQAFASTDTLKLVIQGAAATDEADNLVTDGTHVIENNLASIGELLDFGSNLKNATWDAQTSVMSVSGTGGSTANKRVLAGSDAEIYVPASFTPQGNMMIGFGKQVLTGTAGSVFDEVDYMAYYDPATKIFRVFEKGEMKHMQENVITYPTVKRVGSAIQYLLNGVAITFNQPGAQPSASASGRLYPIAVCYSTTSSVKAYVKGAQLETY
jgi:hypothetical protein